jgi:hypothetical protein
VYVKHIIKGTPGLNKYENQKWQSRIIKAGSVFKMKILFAIGGVSGKEEKQLFQPGVAVAIHVNSAATGASEFRK